MNKEEVYKETLEWINSNEPSQEVTICAVELALIGYVECAECGAKVYLDLNEIEYFVENSMCLDCCKKARQEKEDFENANYDLY